MPHDLPPHAWHTLGTDMFYWSNSHYLLLVDYYSKFPIIRKLSSITSSSVITQMKGIFDEHGIAEALISDGRTQYSSREFKRSSESYGFRHTCSSAHYPRFNGLSERTVQTMKNLLQVSREWSRPTSGNDLSACHTSGPQITISSRNAELQQVQN